ncbi:U3 small nucleolar RNA-associated protein 25 homolog [Neocloeon triangulifer]|uniref:U3 small nucleolar RNA-associated protein 25 homolog n=1 Tax=Neocloeon triangulifer TaxID=2078957 RepID=UPI00286F852D|nr:U3 small nucleolar RNA-associated protein 25 homolog [Neocloeon triangulifer]
MGRGLRRGGARGRSRGGGQPKRGQKRKAPGSDRQGGKLRRDEEADVQVEKKDSSSSSEEEEDEDPYQELLGTMDLAKKNKVVSSDEEDLEEAQEPNQPDEEEEQEVFDEEDEDETEEEKEEESTLASDPFTLHLNGEFDSSLLSAISAEPPVLEMTKLFWPNLGHVQVHLPKVQTEPAGEKKKGLLLLQDKKVYLKPPTVPQRSSSTTDWSKLFVKKQIQAHLPFANPGVAEGGLSGLQGEVFALLNNYHDLYFAERSVRNAEELRFVYCLHAVNHVLKTRAKILVHNAKMAARAEVPDEFRDQGLVRPKVLVLLPFKDAAYRTINMIISILLGDQKGTVMNQKRYIEEFTGEQLALPKKNPKPEDYEILFRGNTDDNFRIGMSFTKKRLKLYTDFYQSDIIVASPLGLRMIIGAEGDEKRDFDFLAGLELVVLDQADVCFEQNWEHVLHTFEHLHLQPKQTHSTDFSRLRFSALAGHSKYLSQTCVLSAVQLPELTALMRRRCRNYAGRAVVANPVKLGSISQVVLHLPQVFHKIEAASAGQCIENRFEVFLAKILPEFRYTLMSHTLIYVPSYFDYVRLRNHFNKQDIGFVQICEYSKDAKIARARDMFFHKEAHFLLYSERFHFFRRIRIKGIRHLIFYQPPTFPHFYPELCNFMQEANQNRKKGGSSNMTVTVLYSKYDAQRLAAIVGSDRASKMLNSDKSVHMMVTGGD